MGEVLEQGENYKIVGKKGNLNPEYLLEEPELSRRAREIVETLQETATEESDTRYYTGDLEENRKAVYNKLDDLLSRHLPNVKKEEKENYKNLVLNNMFGYGKLQPLVEDDNLEEIMVNSPGTPVIVFHRSLGMCTTNISFKSNEEIKNLVDRIAMRVNRKIDLSSPLLDARLEDGSRVNATISPISLDGNTLTIRKFKEDPLTIIDLINYRTINSKLASFLWLCVEGMDSKPLNTLVVGGTGSGKTTTLNCLADFIPTSDRLITIEDTAELNLKPYDNLIRFETRTPNVEGSGGINMEELMKNALRMRPDRVIVGEVRDIEARTLFTAMNTGHDGSMGTLHANTAEETITRLTNPPMKVPKVMVPSLEVIVVEKKLKYKKRTVRKIVGIAEVRHVKRGEEIEINPFMITEWDAGNDSWSEVEFTNLLHKISSFSGISVNELIEEWEIRRTILDWMIYRDIREREKVRKVFQDFYADRASFLDKMVGEKSGED